MVLTRSFPVQLLACTQKWDGADASGEATTLSHWSKYQQY